MVDRYAEAIGLGLDANCTKAAVTVCDPRKNRPLRDGHKSDEVDARKLARLLRAGLLLRVYHGEQQVRDLKELFRLSWNATLAAGL